MFHIYDIHFKAEDLEQLGTKEKFWFLFKPQDNQRWLFKFSRENTGEHWSEKVAEQLCRRLSIPHVPYELALCNGKPGIITPNIISNLSRMVMGNEVLHNHSPNDYPHPEAELERYVRVKDHTVSRVLGCLDRGNILPPQTDISVSNLNSGDVFCGYLMLDVLISNQDRHHENWAIIVNNDTGKQSLCPSYDHAACLGRELKDAEREERLTTKDGNRMVSKFVRKARSELFKFKTDKKPMLTIDCFYHAIEKRPRAKKYWLDKLKRLTDDDVHNIFSNIPDEMISTWSKDFAIKMILENKNRLLNYE